MPASWATLRGSPLPTPPASRAFRASSVSSTKASAVAVRKVAGFSVTSTMWGLPSLKWVRSMASV
jgi:hypothetical protein